VKATLRVLLDQGLPRDVAEQLRTASVECRHVGEIDMSAASDTDILDYAAANGFLVATLDADFHTMLIVKRHVGSICHTHPNGGVEGSSNRSHYPRRTEHVRGRSREWLHDHR
jgi:hypothetical protein